LKSKSGEVRIPNDTELKNEIKTNPIYSQRHNYVNFILSSIDDQSKESTLLKQITNQDIHLTIEHVMPQTLNKSWIESLGENYDSIHQLYLHTLPNLTLTAYNSKYSNFDFLKKKTVENGFNESPLLINKFVKEKNNWNLSALEEREEWWFEKIEKIWPLPNTSFKPTPKGTEFIFEEDKDLTGSKVKGVIILGDTIMCKTWTEVLEAILRNFFILDANLYDYIVTDRFLSKYIKTESKALRTPKEVVGTQYYYENNCNTNTKRDIVFKLAEYLELDKTDIKVILDQ
jgi:Protein of unknown function (DUF1524)